MKTLTKTELNMQVKWLSRYIADFTGLCPLDTFGWDHPDTCDKNCARPGDDEKISQCWARYALEAAVE